MIASCGGVCVISRTVHGGLVLQPRACFTYLLQPCSGQVLRYPPLLPVSQSRPALAPLRESLGCLRWSPCLIALSPYRLIVSPSCPAPFRLGGVNSPTVMSRGDRGERREYRVKCQRRRHKKVKEDSNREENPTSPHLTLPDRRLVRSGLVTSTCHAGGWYGVSTAGQHGSMQASVPQQQVRSGSLGPSLFDSCTRPRSNCAFSRPSKRCLREPRRIALPGRT